MATGPRIVRDDSKSGIRAKRRARGQPPDVQLQALAKMEEAAAPAVMRHRSGMGAALSSKSEARGEAGSATRNGTTARCGESKATAVPATAKKCRQNLKEKDDAFDLALCGIRPKRQSLGQVVALQKDSARRDSEATCTEATVKHSRQETDEARDLALSGIRPKRQSLDKAVALQNDSAALPETAQRRGHAVPFYSLSLPQLAAALEAGL